MQRVVLCICATQVVFDIVSRFGRSTSFDSQVKARRHDCVLDVDQFRGLSFAVLHEFLTVSAMVIWPSNGIPNCIVRISQYFSTRYSYDLYVMLVAVLLFHVHLHIHVKIYVQDVHNNDFTSREITWSSFPDCGWPRSQGPSRYNQAAQRLCSQPPGIK